MTQVRADTIRYERMELIMASVRALNKAVHVARTERDCDVALLAITVAQLQAEALSMALKVEAENLQVENTVARMAAEVAQEIGDGTDGSGEGGADKKQSDP